MGPVRDALRLFRENVWQVFLVILLFVVPIQMVYTLAVNYMTLPFQVLGIPLWPALIKSFFMFIALFLIQLPFISMALQYARNEDIRLGKTLADAFQPMLSIYVMSFFVSFLIVTGSLLLIIPGLVLFLLFLGISYAAIIDGKTWLQGVKQSFAFGSSHFFKLLGLLFVFAVLGLITSFAVLFVLYLVTGFYLILNVSVIITNSLLFSILFFTVSFYYLDWSDGAVGTEVI